MIDVTTVGVRVLCAYAYNAQQVQQQSVAMRVGLVARAIEEKMAALAAMTKASSTSTNEYVELQSRSVLVPVLSSVADRPSRARWLADSMGIRTVPRVCGCVCAPCCCARRMHAGSSSYTKSMHCYKSSSLPRLFMRVRFSANDTSSLSGRGLKVPPRGKRNRRRPTAA